MRIELQKHILNQYIYDYSNFWKSSSMTGALTNRMFKALDGIRRKEYSILEVEKRHKWYVSSNKAGKPGKPYTVSIIDGIPECTCMDKKYRGIFCKHIWMVLLHCEITDSFTAFVIAHPEIKNYITIQGERK